MMNPRFLFIFVVALCCIFLTLGQDVAKSEGDDKFNIKDLKKKINFDNEMKCIEQYFHCLTSSNRTIEKIIKAEKKCCAKTLNDSNDIWFVTFHFCLSRQTIKEIQHCIYKTGFRCRILDYLRKIFPNSLQFEKDMMDRIDPRPKTAEECYDSFLQSYGKAFKEQCKVNTDKNLDPMCKASRVH
ncbi:uncharacterized protein LOC111623316 isoform X3 [Centruroides sculpturatus]|uniref:uncharacterized protein LOC111623316 isoform X3 n=1 Tax=Centruroides sculpturatus TaxID=218467 RepID=UPI000C6DDE59|nr:uncharacterized protein LOC111623316 isoform X3 [Centruroides sculpturatus]